MKKWVIILIALIVLLPQAMETFAQDANASQFFYMVKKLFPEQKDVAIFISQEALSSKRKLMDRAAAQNGIAAKIYLIESALDVGKRIRDLPDESVLVIFNSNVLMKKKTQLYILKNCKTKKISIFTSSRDYTELGALFGIIKNESTFELVLNLKHNEFLKPKFTDAFIQQAGISEVIQ